MPDLTAIAHALSALKAAKDIAESMVGLRDAAAFQGKLIEFQSKIIDANNAASGELPPPRGEKKRPAFCVE